MVFKTRKGRGYHKYDYASHGAAHKRNSELFWKCRADFQEKYGVAFEGFKYIRNLETGVEEIFALEQDPGERDSLSGRCTDCGGRARQLIADHLAASTQLRDRLGLEEAREVELSPETREELEALGYLE